MQRLRPLSFVLIASATAAWALPALAAGDCALGKTKYVANCASCHGTSPNAAARKGSNPAVILTQMTDSSAPGYNSMNFLYPGTVNDADIDDISTYLFYYPGACPVASPILQASPASVAFGSVAVGATSATTTVTISNVGSGAASSVTASTPDATHYPLSSNTCNSVSLAVGASCSFKVAFHPTAAGTLNANLTVARSGGTLSLGVSGTGSAVATPGQLSMPASMSFASQTVGTTSAASSVTITNIGGSAVSVSSVASSNPSEFTIASSTCATVNAGGSCAVGVTFRPGAEGARSGSLSVISNGVGSPQTINASGTGTTATTSSPTVPVVEYYNPVFDHYFITSVAVEVSLLNARQPPFQDWIATGFTFKGYANATAPAASVAICRFFNSTFAPKSSHFYAPHGLGCEATLSGFPDWKLEDDKLFNSMLPDASGACPAGTIPVYRLYNNGMGGAPNHRFVTSLAERQNMINKGFIAEGNGIGVGMCAPQ